MARIMEYGMRNEAFKELMGMQMYTVPETNKSKARSLITQNYLLEQTNITKYIYDEVTGGLPSISASGGASIVFTAEKNGLSYIMVILGAERTYNAKKSWVVEYYGNFEEAWDLLDYGFDNFKVCRLLHDGQSITQFPVTDGENQVVAQSHTSMDAVLPIDGHLDNLIMKYNVENGNLRAPVAQDEKIASLQIWYRNSCIAETELFAMSKVRSVSNSKLDIQGVASRDDSNLQGILRFFGIAFLVVLGLLVLYLLINNIRRTIARNRRRRRRNARRRSY
jgi:D-alanyl-D-alanine carboxypeptidase